MNNHLMTFAKTFQFIEEQVLSPLSAQLLEFCESDLFQTSLKDSEVASSSNPCYKELTSNVVNPSIQPSITNCPTLVDTTTTTTITGDSASTNDFSLMFKDVVTPLDLTNTSHPTSNQYTLRNQDQFDISLLQNQNQVNGTIFSFSHAPSNDPIIPIIKPKTLLNTCDNNIISPTSPSEFTLSSNMLSSTYSFIDPLINANLPASNEGGNLFSGNEVQIHDLEYQGGNNGIFFGDHLPHSFNSNDLEALSHESQQLVNGSGISTTPLAPEITNFESEPLRVTSKLTNEERKEKINKYIKKRNERNFNKKIKYACRKTLADSRPRVRGRFAKHDEFGENNTTNNNHEEDTDEDERNFHQVVKEEEESFESSDILADISGVNSFKCNYSIESWI